MHFTPKIWGVINLTPDSFSDGGKYYNNLENAINHIQQLINDGANVIDVGAQSTRPGALIISQEEEWNRLKIILPLIKKMHKKVLVSLDTTKGAIVEKAASYIDIVNDVSGFKDPQMIFALKQTGLPAVLMHNLGIPADPSNTISIKANVMDEILDWFQHRLTNLSKLGLNTKKLILDPGIGFGKTAQSSLKILKQIACLHKFDLPILVGHSRKSYLRALTNISKTESLDVATAVISLHLVKAKIQNIRVHNVGLNKNFIDLYELFNTYAS